MQQLRYSKAVEEVEAEQKTAQLTILIAAKEQSDRLLLSNLFSHEYMVHATEDGAEVPEMVRESHPDIILLEMDLAGINGVDLLDQLKKAPETSYIPVIIIANSYSEADEEKVLLMGAVDYLAKPLKEKIFFARVSTQLQVVLQMRRIERLGLIDPLTDIPNRRSFNDRITIEWRRAHRTNNPISFLMIDIDKFKDYNDTWGHLQGDECLRCIARLFLTAARRPGDLAARLGGEEFGILLPHTNIEQAAYVAEDIRFQVEKMVIPGIEGNKETTVTISIGVASCIPAADEKIDEFLNLADKNLYYAKRLGRNRIHYLGLED